MKGARSVAIAAALGVLVQGWDNGAVAGALLYLKVEFRLDENPALEGLVVAATLIGAVASVTLAGPAADSLGRRYMLIVSGILFAIAGSVMVWSPTIWVLIVGRFLVGTSIGLAATIAPILISETAPTEIRGQLATLPQLMGSTGLFLAYCMVFGVSLLENPSWRMILGVILIPALMYLGLCLFYLPESPRWLVSKGRMLEARIVLQGLRGQEDVSAELALLVEGLGVGVDTSLEEWLIKPSERNDFLEHHDEGQIQLFGAGGPDEDITWVAQPMKDVDDGYPHLTTRGSVEHNFVDSLVSLLGSIQPTSEFPPEYTGSQDISGKFHLGGDEESGVDGNGYDNDSEDEGEPGVVGDMDESLTSALLQRRAGSNANLPRRDSTMSISSSRGLSRHASSRAIDGLFGETVDSVGIGGGWQLAWRADGETGQFERVYLRQEGGDLSRFGSQMALPGVAGGFNADGDAFQAAALVGPSSVQFNKDHTVDYASGPATVHPGGSATKGPAWSDLADVGVKRALVVGVGIQFLNQFTGINAVLYYTPQILKQSGADAIAAQVGLTADSASIVASALTCLLMLPCIFLAMWLMDRAGRRQLLLTTIPIVGLSLVAIILVTTVVPTGIVQAVGSFVFVSLYICSFVTGFGPIPNILCSEIFPTRVRGLAIGITASTMWICNAIMSYTFPVAIATFGLVGVFLFFAIMSVIAWVFVYLKVPETKGLPLEIICEFFAMSGQSDRRPSHAEDKDEERKSLL